MLKPLTEENRNGFNDVRNVYNPNKYQHTLGEYVQINGQEAYKKKSHEYSDSEDSESSDSDYSDSDDERDDRHAKQSKSSTAQVDENKEKTQTIEIKIVTSNEPNSVPQIKIE